MDYSELIENLKNLETIAYGYNINGEVLGMDCSDFEQIMVDAADAIAELNQYKELGDLDRLRELVQADREGRAVLLPCKEGDTFRHNGLDYKADHWSVILSAFAKDRLAKTGKRICMFAVEDVAEKMAEEMEEQPE